MHRLTNILCPVDFSNSSYQAIEKASFLAQLFQADLTLLHVISVLPKSFGVVFGLDLNSNKMVDKATTNARSLLRDAKKKYVPYAVKCKSSIRVGRTSEQIIKEAEKLKSDLIVISTKGPGKGETPFMGANTNQVISGSPCPVITYHEQPDKEGDNSKGFRKILIPIDPDFETSDLKTYLNRYLSMMSPEIILLSVLSPDNGSEQIDKTHERLEEQAMEIKNIPGIRKIAVKVLSGAVPADIIDRFANQEHCDLIMMNTHGVSGMGNFVIGPVTSNVINKVSLPVFTLRPGSMIFA